MFDPIDDDGDAMRVFDRIRAMFPYEVTYTDDREMRVRTWRMGIGQPSINPY